MFLRASLVLGKPLPLRALIAGKLHPDQFGGQVQYQGRVELAAMNRPARPVEDAAELEGEDIHHLDPGAVGHDRTQGFLMGLVRLRREDGEGLDPRSLFPGLDELVHHPVKRLALKASGYRAWHVSGYVHAVFHGGSAYDAGEG